MNFIRCCLRRIPGIGAAALALSSGASFAGGFAAALVAAERGGQTLCSTRIPQV
jgi:hypothetical protein